MQMTARVGCSSLTLFFCFRHIFLSRDKLCFRVVLLKLYHTVSPLVILLNFQLDFSSAWLLGAPFCNRLQVMQMLPACQPH